MATNIINLSNLDGNNGFRLDGTAANDFSGISVSDAGDVNGDGYTDVIVGAFFADTNGYDSGASYVVFGKAAGFDATMDLASLDGNDGFRLDGLGGLFGVSVSSARDVNGDGFADVITGALFDGPSNGYAGSSYVVFGKATGFTATLEVSTLDGSDGFRLSGVGNGALGLSVSNAGDVNGDGFDDLIVSDIGADPNGETSGSSYVVFGKNSGFDATLDLSSLDGSNGFRLDGSAEYDFSGYSVSGAGDVNGDGFADVIVSAPYADSNGESSGSSYVVFGRAAGFDATLNLSSLDGNNGFRLDGLLGDGPRTTASGAGDVNGDGFADVIVGTPYSGSSYVVFGRAAGFDATLDLSSLNGSDGFRLDGTSDDRSGRSVSGAGDVNGDGFADVIVGAPYASSNGINGGGSSYVMYGKAGGFDAALDLSSIDSSKGFRVDGGVANVASGRPVSSAGDVNGDGFADLMIGDPIAQNSLGIGSGFSSVIFGDNFNGRVTAMGTAKADKLKGSQGVDRMVAGDGDDILIGRGGKDVYHAGAGDDTIEIRDSMFQLADGGAGLDTLTLDASHLDLNLTNERGHINDIEVIDLKGNGSNILTLTALDVLNLSSTTNTLIVDGNGNDHVAGLSEGWNDGGVHDGYHTFSNGEAVLLVGVHVMTDFA